LLSQLANGDEVEILISEGQVPPAAWESAVATGKARASIRRATREAVRTQFAGLGRQIVERAFARAEKPFSQEKLIAALPRLARATLDDALASVGRGEMSSADVLKAVYPDFREDLAKLPPAEGGAGWFGMRGQGELKFKVPGPDAPPAGSIPIRGLSGDLPVRFAPNGGAVPGDRIVGILTPGEGVTVYPIQSPALTAFDDEPWRWLDVRWDVDENNPRRFPAQIALTVINEPGSLGTVTSVIGERDANIDNIVMRNHSGDFRDLLLDIEVWDLKHLSTILAELRMKPVIATAERVNG